MRRALPLLICAALLGVPSAANAATYTVNTTDDVAGSCPTTCSLRAAVTAATASTGVDDTIVLDAKKYMLAGTALSIAPAAADTLTIAGAGARSTTIDANNTSRIFNIAGTAPNVTIRDVRLTGGVAPAMSDGGAVFIDVGTLSIDRTIVSGNTAPASGGGIATNHGIGTSTASITSSSITGNTADGSGAGMPATGGGVFIGGGPATLTNTTVSGNTARTTVLAQGGGIGVTTPGTLSLFNSTVSNNTAQGATANGGGVTLASGGNATNSIVASNKTIAGGTPSTGDCSVAFTGTLANDLSSDASCGFTPANGGKPSTDPQLGNLGDHGGPTDTLALPATSPAVNAGTSAGCPAADQRGVVRPVGTACDIGAVESAPPVVAPGAKVTSVGPTAATLLTTVRNPLVSASVVAFQYGRTTAYGGTSGPSTVPAAAADTPVSAPIAGLAANTTYHYRAVAVNGDGGAIGPDQTFTTAKVAAKAGKKPYLKVTGVPKGCRRSNFTIRLRSKVSGTGVKLRSVKVTLAGKTVKTTKKAGRFRLTIKAAKLKAGKHTIRVAATDSKRRVTRFKKTFTRCGARKTSKKTKKA